jgi:hypothetical protein
VAGINTLNGTIAGVAKNIPMIAVNTINAVTRGLHNAKKLLSSAFVPNRFTPVVARIPYLIFI